MIVVINYHYIRRDYSQPHPGIFGVTPDGFKKQLEILSTYGNFISQEELKKRIVLNMPLLNNKLEFLVTFDDGLKEQVTEALPILDSMGIPAVFYVNTANFEKKEFSLVHQLHLLRSQISPAEFIRLIYANATFTLNDEEKSKGIAHYRYDDKETAILKYILNFKLSLDQQKQIVDQIFPTYFGDIAGLHSDFYMNSGDLKLLADMGYLGSHAHDHIPLGLYNAQQIEQQVIHSKHFLESLTGQSIYGISYPYGSREACGNGVPQISEKAGMIYGFSTERAAIKTLNNPLLLPRFNCNDLPGGKSNLYPNLDPSNLEGSTWGSIQ